MRAPYPRYVGAGGVSDANTVASFECSTPIRP